MAYVEVECMGQLWELADGVYSPAESPATAYFTSRLPYPEGGTFLEVGCGAGVTAVTASLRGCGAVTAVDIAAEAVANTSRNVELHNVQATTRVLLSDMFDTLRPDERFDLIYWNAPFVEASEDYQHTSTLSRALCDPGYQTYRRYLHGASRHLNHNGRLFLGFGSIGNRAKLNQLAAGAGWQVRSIGRWSDEGPIIANGVISNGAVEYSLLELSPV